MVTNGRHFPTQDRLTDLPSPTGTAQVATTGPRTHLRAHCRPPTVRLPSDSVPGYWV